MTKPEVASLKELWDKYRDLPGYRLCDMLERAMDLLERVESHQGRYEAHLGLIRSLLREYRGETETR